MSSDRPSNIDEYISAFSVDVQKMLEEMRSIIKETIFEVEESISYGMPTYRLEGKTLLHFAAHKSHIGLYPVPTDGTFEQEFSPYKTSGRGTIQFPFDKPLPRDSVAKIATFRAEKIWQTDK